MDIAKHFFFNLSLMVVLLSFLGLLAKRIGHQLPATMTAFYFIGSTVICFLFSYSLNDEYTIDLRMIPIILGSLYAGMGVLLSLTSLLLRAFFGFDMGFIFHAIFYLTFAHLSLGWSRKFIALPYKKRILSIVFLTSIMGLIIFTTYAFITRHFAWDAFFAYLVIQPLGAGTLAFFLEELCKSFKFNRFHIESQKMEAVEQMGAAISHEIRNPLTAALGFVQLLENDDATEEDRNFYLSILKKELHSAETIIHDYLTFSNPEIEKEKLDLIEETTSVINSLRPLADKNGVRIVTVLPKQVVIEGDRQKLKQCLVNLMKNAIEAMDQGGLLKVKVTVSNTHSVIRIKDSGQGMSEEQINRIGEPYYSTKGEKGTGLGLMVVFSIVKAMDGTIHVESEIGKGTTFEITLPTVDTKPLSPPIPLNPTKSKFNPYI